MAAQKAAEIAFDLIKDHPVYTSTFQDKSSLWAVLLALHEQVGVFHSDDSGQDCISEKLLY